MQSSNFFKTIDLLSINRDMPPISVEYMLDIDGCLYLKKRFDFIEVSNVILSANIKKISKNCWELEGDLVAQITQKCVVTCKPVKEKLEINLKERYVLQAECASMIAEIDIGAPNVEVLETNILDIKEFIAQIIGVEAESFPKLNSTSETQLFDSKNKKENPFAKLASLKK